MGALSEREVRILVFERNWWRQPGAKEQAIRDMLGMSATRYYQMLNELIDRPEALVFEPVLVKRLRRQRAKRERIRSAQADRGDAGAG
jgi:Protein of unknown function (DUF3263)